MGNKTIYVKNEELWERAKKLAGREGLSGLIADALQAYLDKKELEDRGFQKFRLPYKLEMGEVPIPEGADHYPFAAERIAFEGRLLASTANPDDGSIEGYEEVYLTKAGKLLVVSGLIAPHIVLEYGVCDSISQLKDHPIIARMAGDDRAHLLDRVSEALGDDWAIHIE